MEDQHRSRLELLVESIGQENGELDAGLRRDLLEGRNVAGALGTFAAKVRDQPGRITDAHIEALRRAGYSEDQIFECIVAASVGAGLERLWSGLLLLGEMG